jgi:hypothetical protein
MMTSRLMLFAWIRCFALQAYALVFGAANALASVLGVLVVGGLVGTISFQYKAGMSSGSGSTRLLGSLPAEPENFLNQAG